MFCRGVQMRDRVNGRPVLVDPSVGAAGDRLIEVLFEDRPDLRDASCAMWERIQVDRTYRQALLVCAALLHSQGALQEPVNNVATMMDLTGQMLLDTGEIVSTTDNAASEPTGRAS